MPPSRHSKKSVMHSRVKCPYKVKATNFITLLIVIGLGVLSFVACMTLMVPTSDDVQRAKAIWQDADSNQLITGMQLYKRRCGTCHPLYPPTKYDSSHWVKFVDEYATEAKLTQHQKELILRYLITMANSKRK